MSSSQPFTHLDAQGQARMVDVGAKPDSDRLAVAEGWAHMAAATLTLIRNGQISKGEVMSVARIAAIQAAKRTHELIPLCHPLMLNSVEVVFSEQDSPPAIRCQVSVRSRGRTGVEMEALTAVAVGLLTLYDMCKAVDRGISIDGLRLLQKQGGKSGDWSSA